MNSINQLLLKTSLYGLLGESLKKEKGRMYEI